MSQRDDYEPGVPCWVDTLQPDPDGAMAFYAALFGWQFAGPGEMPGDPPGRYSVARLRGRDVAGIGSQPAGNPPPAPGWNTYVHVASADDAARRATSAGGAVLIEPFDALPAGRMAVLADPAGAPFCVWEPRERKGAQLVNEPAAWAMSHLGSPDTERAAAFYGALFGWTTETFGEGAGAVTMFRLPGYVGGQPQQPVSREVVATMAASDDARPTGASTSGTTTSMRPPRRPRSSGARRSRLPSTPRSAGWPCSPTHTAPRSRSATSPA